MYCTQDIHSHTSAWTTKLSDYSLPSIFLHGWKYLTASTDDCTWYLALYPGLLTPVFVACSTKLAQHMRITWVVVNVLHWSYDNLPRHAVFYFQDHVHHLTSMNVLATWKYCLLSVRCARSTYSAGPMICFMLSMYICFCSFVRPQLLCVQ